MNKELITSKRLLRLLAAVPVLLSGCVESEDYSSLKNDSEYVEMVFTQDNDGTKADIEEDGSGSFTEGDKVGLYIYGEQTRQVILTMEDGQWTPKLLKSELGARVLCAFQHTIRPERMSRLRQTCTRIVWTPTRPVTGMRTLTCCGATLT